jgi:hypothetical protein
MTRHWYKVNTITGMTNMPIQAAAIVITITITVNV